MSRRVIAAVVAAVLALLGAVLLITYVSSADERAMADMAPVEVMVVSAPIVQGTPAEELAAYVSTERLPSASVGPGAVTSLSELSGLVASTDLQPGEQVLVGRFTSPDSAMPFGGIPVPEGLHQVTVPLDSPRVVGGTVMPGDIVGVFASFTSDTPVTHLVLDKILVTRVQGGLTPASPAAAEDSATDEAAEGGDPAAAPVHEGGVMVTLAVNARDAETIVFAAEHGSIWLSVVDPTASTDGTRIVDPGNVYQ